MNRIIKFRAWSETKKKLSEPFTLEDCCKECGTYVGTSSTFKHGSPIIQFIGLWDENEQEIYDNYIIQWKNGSKELVEYKNYGFEHSDEGIGYGIISKKMGEKMIAPCKIIGNIYENPELINKTT